jgi:hypothetical protein
MKPVTICVLAKYNEVFTGFLKTSTLYEPSTPKILVRDGHDVPSPEGWQVIQGPEKFSMAGNGNLALKAAPADSDILYCGDDIRLLAQNTTGILQQQAYIDPAIGILTPRIIGRGSEPQMRPVCNLATVPPIEMWFPCIYIKRELIEKIGYLDEEFNEFGSDDFDYCLRTVKAGYRLAVTDQIAVEHESASDGGPTTFTKKLGAAEWRRQQIVAREKLRRKHRL